MISRRKERKNKQTRHYGVTARGDCEALPSRALSQASSQPHCNIIEYQNLPIRVMGLSSSYAILVNIPPKAARSHSH